MLLSHNHYGELFAVLKTHIHVVEQCAKLLWSAARHLERKPHELTQVATCDSPQTACARTPLFHSHSQLPTKINMRAPFASHRIQRICLVEYYRCVNDKTMSVKIVGTSICLQTCIYIYKYVYWRQGEKEGITIDGHASILWCVAMMWRAITFWSTPFIEISLDDYRWWIDVCPSTQHKHSSS